MPYLPLFLQNARIIDVFVSFALDIMDHFYSFLNEPERFFESAFFFCIGVAGILLPEHIRIMERCEQTRENRDAKAFVSDTMWIILIKHAAVFQGILDALLSRDALAKSPPATAFPLLLSAAEVNPNKVLMTDCVKGSNNILWKSWRCHRSS